MIIIEHDPLLYQEVAGMIDLAFQAPSDAVKEAALLLCSPGNDAFLEKLNRNADRAFYFDEGPRVSTKLVLKSLLEGLEESENPGGLDIDSMATQTRGKPLEPRIKVNPGSWSSRRPRRF